MAEHRGESISCLLLEALHCSLYPGQEVGDLHENPWRGPVLFSIGENPLDHVVTHEGVPGVPLWAERGRTELASQWSCPLHCPGDGGSVLGAAWDIGPRAGLVPSLSPWALAWY